MSSLDKQLSIIRECQSIILSATEDIAKKNRCLVAKRKYIVAADKMAKNRLDIQRSVTMIEKKKSKKTPNVNMTKYNTFIGEIEKLKAFDDMYLHKIGTKCYFNPLGLKPILFGVTFWFTLIMISILLMFLITSFFIPVLIAYGILILTGLVYIIWWMSKMRLNRKLQKMEHIKLQN